MSVFCICKKSGRDVRFLGIAVPGNKDYESKECLQVVEDNTEEGLITNYKAIFTILNVERIDRRWLLDLDNFMGIESDYAPLEWKEWIYNNELLTPKNIDEDSSNNEFMEKFDSIINELDSIDFKLEEVVPPKNNIDKTIISHKSNKDKKGVKRDYLKECKEKLQIGIIGESIIFRYEKKRLENNNNELLKGKAKEVEWTSKEKGDGVGYDIKSFDIKDGEIVEKYIEVKSTLKNDKPFEITSSEVSQSKELNQRGIYSIARVYDINLENYTAKYYFKDGSIEENYKLDAISFMADRK